MRKRIVVLLLATVIASCHVGPRTARFKPAQEPAGVHAIVELDRGARLEGELLAVDETALMMLNESRVTRVRYASIRRATFAQTRIKVREHVIAAESRDPLRLLSRFPQGVSPALLNSLLAAYGQTEILLE
jgi:hypothetical protein